MTTYYLYTVQGYQKLEETGNLSDFATISIIAKSEEEAKEKAKKLVTKNFYRISGVMEYTYDTRFDNK